MLILALSCERWFALAALWDCLLLCYDAGYMAANLHLPVLSQQIQAEVTVSIRLMDKIPTHSFLQNKFSAIVRNPC